MNVPAPKNVRTALLTAIASAAALLAGTTAAHAADNICNANTVCLEANANFSGTQYNIPAGRSVPDLGSFDHQMSSYFNNTSRDYCWYASPNYKGAHALMPAGQAANIPKSENDQASSARPAPKTGADPCY